MNNRETLKLIKNRRLNLLVYRMARYPRLDGGVVGAHCSCSRRGPRNSATLRMQYAELAPFFHLPTSQHLDVRTLLSRSGQKNPGGLLCFALLCLADIWAKPLRVHWNVDFNGGSVQTESLLSAVGRVAWNLTSREESFLSDSSFRWTAGVCGTLAWILHGKNKTQMSCHTTTAVRDRTWWR